MSVEFAGKFMNIEMLDKNHFIYETIIKFITIKSENPKRRQEEICKELGISKSTLHRNIKKLGVDINYHGKHSSKTF